ncbi:MAG: hypothetical protein N2512_09600 [Armatimonadetes bacterium]|nr:hypothetical protein [Armatimonadota bacterium]
MAAMAVTLVLFTGGCARPQSTCDISSLCITRYRYLADPRDPQVHAVVEVKNTGPLTVERALLVVTGIGRNGEKRGESRVLLERLQPGERRTVTTQFTNRGRLATVEVGLEPAPEAERAK